LLSIFTIVKKNSLSVENVGKILQNQNISGSMTSEQMLEMMYPSYRFKVTDEIAYDTIKVKIINPITKKGITLLFTKEVIYDATNDMLMYFIEDALKQLEEGRRKYVPYSFNPTSRYG